MKQQSVMPEISFGGNTTSQALSDCMNGLVVSAYGQVIEQGSKPMVFVVKNYIDFTNGDRFLFWSEARGLGGVNNFQEMRAVKKENDGNTDTPV